MLMLRRTLWIAFAILIGLAAGVTFTRNDAVAQLRAALVKDVDEPARVPYEFEVTPTRPFLNSYSADFPAVPAGKRLKLTRISGFVWGVPSSNSGAFVSLNDPNGGIYPRVAWPLSYETFAYFGFGYHFNLEVDHTFEAGQSPKVEMGVSAGTGGLPTPNSAWTRIRLHGYLVDLSL
jgi:hypothetical protein